MGKGSMDVSQLHTAFAFVLGLLHDMAEVKEELASLSV
jgi:hypothetical protein